MTQELFSAIDRLVERVRVFQEGVAPEVSYLLPDLAKMRLAATNLGEMAFIVTHDPEWSAAEPLTSSVRHDLLNGLNQIIGYGEMLGEEAGDIDLDLSSLERDVRGVVLEAKAIATAIEQPGVRAAPAQDSAVRPPAAAPSPAASYPSFSAANPVLVVDDNELNRDVLSSFLRRNGLRVVEAEDGLAALAVLEQQPIDLVLLDVMMPRLDGYGVLERMYETPALRDIPVLMVSGLSEIESVVRCIEKGAADYLPKPFNPVLLRARIGACLEKKAALDRERQTLSALKASQDHLAKELAEAGRYVRSLLSPPMSGPIAVDWRFLPSTHLGGDALGHHWIDPEHLALFVLDVCGHGVGAALLSVSVVRVLRLGALHNTDFRDPAQVLKGLNDTFQMDEHNNQYFTMWYGVYQPATRELRYTSGGHPPAVVVEQSDGAQQSRRFGHAGLIVGAMPDISYTSETITIPKGAHVYLFSDGAYEITLPTGDMMSLDDFEQIILRLSADRKGLLDGLVGTLKELRGSGHFEDDVSVMEVTFD